jgi:membrane fusion protein, multidrug efflux system
MTRYGWNPGGPGRFAVLTLFLVLFALGGSLMGLKRLSVARAEAAAASQPEPAEVVEAAIAVEVEHGSTTSAIGTVVAMRSITLRNEMPGTVRFVRLDPGRIVEAGSVLVRLDVMLEEAELRALQAQAELAESTLARVQRMFDGRAASAIELDIARAEVDVARAQIARTEAVIARKTIRAPFRARVGIADVHVGQFLDTGTLLTTLQSVDSEAHVDFAVAQAVAEALAPGTEVTVLSGGSGGSEIVGRVVAVPVNALRKGPGGDHVFVLEEDPAGQLRAALRPVEAGPVIGDLVAIDAGLEAGDRIAAAGSFKLRDGALVHLAPAADPQALTLR